MLLIWLMNVTQFYPCIFHPCMSLVALLQGKGSRLLRCTVWLVDYKSFKNLLRLSEVQQKVLLLTKSLPLFTIIEQNIMICQWQVGQFFAKPEG